MRALAGAMIVLAGAVILAAVVLGNAICDAANRTVHGGVQEGTFAAAGWRIPRDG